MWDPQLMFKLNNPIKFQQHDIQQATSSQANRISTESHIPHFNIRRVQQ